MAIAVIDDKGRIQIPKEIKEELCLKSGEEFEVKTEGKIKSGNRTISPEEIKSIWKMR